MRFFSITLAALVAAMCAEAATSSPATQPSTQPEIAEIMVSEAENLVYVRRTGDVGFEGIQSLEDLRNNWNRLLDAAQLTPDERREAVDLFNRRIARVPGVDG